MKPVFYFCDLWRTNYYFFLGWKWPVYKRYVQKKWDREWNQEEEPAGKSIIITGPIGFWAVSIWINKKNNFPTLAHECLHAANWTLDRAGVNPSFSNDEVQTYLMTNLIRKALGED